MWRGVEALTEEEESYLHGHCDTFVINNFKYGDSIIVLVEFDESINKNCILHCFIERDNNYVDIRGETSNYDDVLDDFDYGEYVTYVYRTLENFKSFIISLKVESSSIVII